MFSRHDKIISLNFRVSHQSYCELLKYIKTRKYGFNNKEENVFFIENIKLSRSTSGNVSSPIYDVTIGVNPSNTDLFKINKNEVKSLIDLLEFKP